MRINLLKSQPHQRFGKRRTTLDRLEREMLFAILHVVVIIALLCWALVVYHDTPIKDVPFGIIVFIAAVMFTHGRR